MPKATKLQAKYNMPQRLVADIEKKAEEYAQSYVPNLNTPGDLQAFVKKLGEARDKMTEEIAKAASQNPERFAKKYPGWDVTKIAQEPPAGTDEYVQAESGRIDKVEEAPKGTDEYVQAESGRFDKVGEAPRGTPEYAQAEPGYAKREVNIPEQTAESFTDEDVDEVLGGQKKVTEMDTATGDEWAEGYQALKKKEEEEGTFKEGRDYDKISGSQQALEDYKKRMAGDELMADATFGKPSSPKGEVTMDDIEVLKPPTAKMKSIHLDKETKLSPEEATQLAELLGKALGQDKEKDSKPKMPDGPMGESITEAERERRRKLRLDSPPPPPPRVPGFDS